MNDVVFVDTETLGLDADVHPVWEVGLVLPDGSEREWQVRVSDRDVSLAHPRALEVNGFAERYGVTRAVDRPEDVVHDLLAVLPARCHLAGVVVSFDEERLRRLLWRFGAVPPWHFHLIDVEALAAGYLGASTHPAIARLTPFDDSEPRSWQPPWDSGEMSLALGVDPAGFDRHTALGYARWARAMYRAVFP